METMNDILVEIGDEELRHEVNTLLLGVQMLACVQNNLMDDIKHLLEENSKYKFQVKHNLKEIQALILRNVRSCGFFGKLSQETIDSYMEDYEVLEKMIYVFIKN